MPDGGGFWHEAAGTDCLLSIAAQHGFFWQTLWNHPQNASLKELRKSPSVLLEGDRVFIPEKRLRQESAATEKKHCFKLLNTPAIVRLRILRDGEPRKQVPYVAEVDGTATKGQTDAEGLVTLAIVPTARQVILRVGSEDDMEVYNLALGGLDPATEESGARQRLENLGFDCGTNGSGYGRALREFQLRQKLPLTGELDKDTRQALMGEHGS